MNTMRRLMLTTLGPVAGLLALSLAGFQGQRALDAAHANRLESHRLADELRRSSDELTRLARTYCVTGDAEFERQYWHVLDVRNGKQPRPDGRTVPLRTLMERQGFTAAEFAKLKQAEDNSNALVTTETIAMNAMQGRFADDTGGYSKQAAPDPDLARRIMHDAAYHADKASIMGPIGEFERLIDGRTAAAVRAGRSRSYAIALATVGLAAAAAVATWWTVGRHARALRDAIDHLGVAVENVGSGSTQLSAASQSLARGATEQVAAVEGISQAARQTAGMATENARRAESARAVVAREQEQCAAAAARIAEMVGAMEAIKTAGARISNVNKVIDELAFQTNLLALNAAVEAARAGAAGQGFAVVADEVRTLARRSADAARETVALIEESLARTNAGDEKLREVTSAITALAEHAAEVRSLVEEVSAGSREQHAAVAGINTALHRIEEVSQQAAAGAEQGSSCAEQLTAQTASLIDVVTVLGRMVATEREPAGVSVAGGRS